MCQSFFGARCKWQEPDSSGTVFDAHILEMTLNPEARACFILIRAHGMLSVSTANTKFLNHKI